MYHLFRSPHITKLAKELSGLLADNKPDNPLKPVEIVVPNKDTARWLSLHLAELNGITANNLYRLPSEWLWKKIREKHKELPDVLPSDPGPMTWSIYTLLGEESVLQRFPILKKWLKRQTGKTGIHRWQLSRQISSVFDQYQVYRPDMLYAWEKEGGDGTSSGWQPELWNLLNRRWKELKDNNLKYHRAELFRQVYEDQNSNRPVGNQPVYLFNTGLIPPPISRLLLQISKSAEVYHLAVSSAAPAGLQDNVEYQNETVESFSKEQQEQVDIIGEFDKANPGFVNYKKIEGEEVKTHNLGLIQQSIMKNNTIPEIKRMDRSIEIRSCHNPLRELEVLYQYLLQLFSENEDISPDDILVVTPDIHHYAPFIRAVFGTREEGLPHLPYYIAGSSPKSSGIKLAFMDLMELSGSRFRKEDVIDFMFHSAVCDRFQLSDTDLSLVRQWFDENRVVWGLDGPHRAEFQQPEEELQTWQHAIRRGWLGQLISEKPGTISNGLLLYPGISSADEKLLWAKVNSILRLLSHVRTKSLQKLDLPHWEKELKKWLDFFISDKPVYEEERHSVTSTIEQVIREAETGQAGNKIPFSLIRNSLTDKLDKNSGPLSFYTRGLLFNSMVPVRSLPFKVIALLGLNDDQFPRQPVTPEFDLMSSERKPGERDRKYEDRNLFLETVMSAKDVHYSSFVGRNQKDDEAVPPSPILDEWIHLIAGSHNLNPEDCVKNERLNGFSVESFLKGAEGSFSHKYGELVKGLLAGKNIKGLDVDIQLPEPDDLSDELISFENLLAFYRNPAGFFFKNRLDIYLKGFDDEREDEFRIDGLAGYVLFRYIFGWLLNGTEKKRIKEILLLSGYLPEGWPGERKLIEIMNIAENGIRQIRESGYTPGQVSHSLDIRLDHFSVKGLINSSSEKGMLDIHLSSESGRSMLSSWIRHLALCCEKKDKNLKTDVLYDLKKGSGKWRRFQYEPEAGDLLNELIDVYKKGMSTPLNLYIDSAYAYASNIEKGETAAMKHALFEWGGDYKIFPERANQYLEFLLGKEADADPEEIAAISERLYTPMFRNMEILS